MAADKSILRVFSNSELTAEEERRRAEEVAQTQNTPLISGLASYVRSCWDPARMAKRPIEERMLRAQRQRNGEYEADKLAAIAATGGSAIYMQITEVKCRAAESWIRDILLDGGAPPWELKPSPIPDLSPNQQVLLEQEFMQTILDIMQATGVAPEQRDMPAMKELFEHDFRMRLLQSAQEKADRMTDKIKDQFFEGGWNTAFNEFITDLVTFPTAFMKGPVVRKQVTLRWAVDELGRMIPQVQERLAPEYERVDPYRIYPEPGISNLNNGYVFEHRPMSRSDLAALIGVPGYDDNAIREALLNGPRASWFFSSNELVKDELEAKHNAWMTPTDRYDGLEFWGKVSGRMLLDWGMDAQKIPDPDKEYNACVFLVGNYVLKATLNYDPLGHKPYTYTSMFKVPGALWGRSVPEAIADIQGVCNAAARSLVNNMGIASGPQVEVNIERLAPGEDLTGMFPWKVWQVINDKTGGSGPALHFTQPEDNASTLMAVYEKFSRMADEHSGIPSYVSGDISVTGAGRTSSGLSMLMGAAGKGIRQVVSYIDSDVIKPTVTRQFHYNMRYDEDESVKGDLFVEPLGAVNLAVRETAEVRRLEFLQATANPIDLEIMGPEGRAAVLREVSKSLQMRQEEIVPSRQKMKMKMMAKAAAPPEAGQQAGIAPTPAPTQQLLPDGAVPGGASSTLSRNVVTGAP